MDDARLVIDLVRTAAGYGALATTRTKVTGVEKDASGRVIGAKILDLETGTEKTVKAKHIINATGVWTEETEALANQDAGLKVLASKGVHITVPRDRIKATSGIFTKTEKSVLFIIPWQRYWIIGTTDTPYTQQDRLNPVATRADIDYVLMQANKLIADELTHEDVISTFAGLRPLLQPVLKDGSDKSSTKVSREHTVTQIAPGMSAIAGGKLTTYRVMAEDAVDFALGERAKTLPSVTERIKLVGAEGYEVLASRAEALAAENGWDAARTEHLLERYGAELTDIIAQIEKDPSLGVPLAAAPQFLRADVLQAVRAEGALHLEDVLIRRVRLDLEAKDRGLAAAEEIISIMAPELGWDEATQQRELATYRKRVEAIEAASTETSDERATAHLINVPTIVG